MLIDEKNIARDSVLALRHIDLIAPSVAANKADTLVDSVVPGYPFEIVKVQHFADTVTATASYNVKIGATAALNAAAVPVAATRGDATLGTALRGDADDAINLHATTNATGAFANLRVRVTIRPTGLRGE